MVQLEPLESTREQLHHGTGATSSSLLAITLFQLFLHDHHTCSQLRLLLGAKPTRETSCGPSFIASSHAGLPGVIASAKSPMGTLAGPLLARTCLSITVDIHVRLCRSRVKGTDFKESQASIC